MIDEVPYNEVLNIRQQAMYPDKDKEYVVLPDDQLGIHMGYYKSGEPVSVLSLFLENSELQFRKFATLSQHQGKGYGSELMKWMLDYAKDMQFNRLWCNARIDKTDFYKKFGFVETDNTFERSGHKYIIVEKYFLNNISNQAQ